MRALPLYWYQGSLKCVFFRKFSTFFRFCSPNFEFLTRSESRFLAKRMCLFSHQTCSIFCTKTEPLLVSVPEMLGSSCFWSHCLRIVVSFSSPLKRGIFSRTLHFRSPSPWPNLCVRPIRTAVSAVWSRFSAPPCKGDTLAFFHFFAFPGPQKPSDIQNSIPTRRLHQTGERRVTIKQTLLA